jgi:parallel beta-helix repeat protein
MKRQMGAFCAVLVVLFAVTASPALALPSPWNPAPVVCSKYATPTGSDTGLLAGTLVQPFKTVQKLADSLSSGQIGCLRAGTYSFNQTVKVTHAGITLTSFPGERATIRGQLWIALGADGVTISELNLDGSTARPCAAGDTCAIIPSPDVSANDVVFRDDDITNHHSEICFVIGNTEYGAAARTVLDNNRIHDCGRLPSVNEDHGIYVADAQGTVIRNNTIYDNADRGIQLYPNADGSLITGNVIDGNGEGIIVGGDGGEVSSDNVVERNIITNSILRFNVESWYPAGNPIGTGNVVRNNCVHGANGWYGGADGSGADWDGQGYTAQANLAHDPLYVNRGLKDFRLQWGSPCASL